jgi:hypothetical protein
VTTLSKTELNSPRALAKTGNLDYEVSLIHIVSIICFQTPRHPRPWNQNEYTLKPSPRIYWRASLVPAAVVIPAPIAYIKVVVVKKLVVGFRRTEGGLLASITAL